MLGRIRKWQLGRIKEIASIDDVSHATAKRVRIRAICPQQGAVRLARRIQKVMNDQDLVFLFYYDSESALADGAIHTRIRIGNDAHRRANGMWAGNAIMIDDKIEIVFEKEG